MIVSITPLENAIARLQEALALYQAGGGPDAQQSLIRDGLIQRFEFVYELSHKTLKRALEAASASPEQYDQMPFADLIRSANEQGLLRAAWPVWKKFREMRSRTSHTYDEAIAVGVVAAIPAFLAEVVDLRDRLRGCAR